MSDALLDLGPPPRRRRLVSLTPMIDVVFLLLIFFMLASRFSVETTLTIAAGGGDGPYRGAPRLVGVAPEGLSLNGRPIALDALPEALARLAPDREAAVILRPDDQADTQRLVSVIDALSAAGFANLVVAE